MNHKGRIIVSSLVGTTIEFYDFYIYATAAISVFPLLFFHSSGGNGALLASLATFGVAFVA
ncbi:MAG: MFS transporter, partial [Propionibacterium sp.]|nr:MFS transporter [Propionibacterium sp.]